MQEQKNIPKHVGIIMDGNGRWATNKKLPRTSGHKEGVEVARKIIDEACKIGITYLTLYTFSTENWKRTQDEVGFLMNLIKLHLRTEFEFYKKKGIHVLHLGKKEGLPKDIVTELVDVEQQTKGFTNMNLALAINYGGKDEIFRAIQKINGKSLKNEDEIPLFFDIPELPPLDLLIRTGGEKRLSNFLLWHAAYAELEFSDILWPDYTQQDLHTAIDKYTNRNRRFGDITKKR